VTAPAFTAEAIVAERPDLQPTGERYVELAYTGFAVAGVPPHHRLEVARFIRTLLSRPPIVAGAAYAAHREILGSLVIEIEALTVHDALDVPDEPADIRDPVIAAAERQAIAATREWAELRRAETTAAYGAQIDDVVAGEDGRHTAAAAALDDAASAALAALDAPAPAAAAEAADSVWA
jgi:hypothetical protein